MKQKTAMMELVDYMKANFHLTDESLEKFEQLLKKEKEQISDAYANGFDIGSDGAYLRVYDMYYNETYLEEGKQ